MTMMTYGEAIREGMSIRMRENPNVVLFGEDVGAFGGCFGVSAGMFDEFGPERVRDTPISEGAIIGCAVGAAATGLRPIAELMFCDFLTVGMDQLVNQAAKMRYMFGGKISMPMVVRLPAGAGTGAAAQHSQSLEAWLTHVPGLKVVYPSCAQDALGLMLAAIDDEDPVMYFEQKTLFGVKGEVTSLEPIPLGKGRVARPGSDLSIITYGKQVYDALEAADKLAGEGVDVEVIDLRSLYPLDKELIGETIAKTHKAIVITEEVKRGGYGGEISAIIGEEFFDYLDAPVIRIGALDTPVPFAPNLEQYYIPNAQDILVAAKKLF
ncbi:MAG TPA: alpha-ketoacid dehydrogenase subunit beta [Candidatus Scatomorpha intestinigallinarum]|jgi:pyruvate dehydrogenase E1 component beta subunit|uniref:Alpha-ketoacid dehydrogenase subunit beta n=2 Tax=Candidatus Scatomorpha TaxID=2840598 RepID=A0A9D1G5E2_9FIRM|nr:alpha-ketoacid dehydrogenase subunit beta [Candidatus Scatomorpha intestinigallinarum]HIS97506.1 alpha-ketoacid dehydrogenase subunit beta [Candidatus Scatomorpha pullistercoris]